MLEWIDAAPTHQFAPLAQSTLLKSNLNYRLSIDTPFELWQMDDLVRYLPSMEHASHAQTEIRTPPVDRWTANSLLQKSIRRGEAELAAGAAAIVFADRPSNIWRRLVIIAFEDVGVGSIDAVLATTAACLDATWRRQIGDPLAIIRVITRLLAEAPKDRCTDYLICAAQRHPALAQARSRLAALPPEMLGRAITEHDLPVAERSVAAWFATGLANKGGGTGRGYQDLQKHFLAFGVPKDIALATDLAARRFGEPILVMLPLVWAALRQSENVAVREHPALMPASRTGVPLCALDQFTRIGREAIRSFARYNSDLRAIVGKLPAAKQFQAVATAVFYVDSARVCRSLEWDQTRSLERLAIEADLLPNGIASESVDPLLYAVRLNLSHLDKIRAELADAPLGDESGR